MDRHALLQSVLQDALALKCREHGKLREVASVHRCTVTGIINEALQKWLLQVSTWSSCPRSTQTALCFLLSAPFPLLPLNEYLPLNLYFLYRRSQMMALEVSIMVLAWQ